MQDRKNPSLKIEECVVVSNRATGTDDCFLLQARSSVVAERALPGQFVMVRLANRPFPYLGRPLSFADVDTQDPEVFALAYVVVGEGTRALAAAVPGDTLDVVGPLGNGFEIQKAPAHVFVAGGIGSAPFPLLARAVSRLDPGADRVLCLGAGTASALHLAGEIEDLGIRVETATLDGSAGFHGNVVELLGSLEFPAGSRFYACGPNPMLASLAEHLQNTGHPCQAALEERMACGFGACNGCAVPVKVGEKGWRYDLVCHKGPVFDIETVVWDRVEASDDAAGSPACR